MTYPELAPHRQLGFQGEGSVGLMDRLQSARSQVTGEAAVTEIVLHEAAPAPRGAAQSSQQWGKPGRCPECDGRGYLDHVDLVDRIMYQHCTECRHRWTVNESELAAHG